MRISGGRYQPMQHYIMVGFSSPAQAFFFLVCVGDSVGVGYCPCIMPRPEVVVKESITKCSLVVKSSDHHDFHLILKSPSIAIKDEQNCLTWFSSFSKLYWKSWNSLAAWLGDLCKTTIYTFLFSIVTSQSKHWAI